MDRFPTVSEEPVHPDQPEPGSEEAEEAAREASIDDAYREKEQARLEALEAERDEVERKLGIMSRILRMRREASVAEAQQAQLLRQRLALADATSVSESLKLPEIQREGVTQLAEASQEELSRLQGEEEAFREQAASLKEEADALADEHFPDQPVGESAQQELWSQANRLQGEIESIQRTLE